MDFHWLFAILAGAIAAAVAFLKTRMDAPQSQNLPPTSPVEPPPAPLPPIVETKAISPSEIYEAAKSLLGQKIYDDLDPSIPKEVGCVQSVSRVLQVAGFDVPATGLKTVNALIDWLLSHGFKEDRIPTVGSIITAHRPDKSDPAFAHCGIVLKFGIASNDSANGHFAENYSVSGWERAFVIHGSQTRYFSPEVY